MRKSTKKVIALAIGALFSAAVFASENDSLSKDDSIESTSVVCKYLPFLCGASVMGSNGDGIEPPKPKKEGSD